MIIGEPAPIEPGTPRGGVRRVRSGGVQLGPSERQRRSELARRLHREGKLGGPSRGRLGGQAKARKASELAAEIVERHRDAIEAAIVDGLGSPRRSDRLKAAELALK